MSSTSYNALLWLAVIKLRAGQFLESAQLFAYLSCAQPSFEALLGAAIAQAHQEEWDNARAYLSKITPWVTHPRHQALVDNLFQRIAYADPQRLI